MRFARNHLLSTTSFIERLSGVCFAPEPDGEGGGGGGDAAAAAAAALAAAGPTPEQVAAWNATKVTLANGNVDRAAALEKFDSDEKLFAKLTQADPVEVDWRKQMAGDDPAELEFLQRYTDPAAARKAWKAAAAKVTDGGLVKIPGENATPEEIAEYNKALGVPAKAEEYKITAKPVDGYKPTEADTSFLTGMTGKLHEAISKGAKPTDIVNLAHQLYYDAAAESLAQIEATAADAAVDGEKINKALWPGAQYETNIRTAIAAAKHFFPGNDAEFDALMGAKLDTGHALFDHPIIQQMFAQIGRQAGVREDPFFLALRDGNTGFDPVKRKAEIMKLREGSSADRAEYAKLSAPGGELEQLNVRLTKKAA